MTPVDNEGSRADENTAYSVVEIAERYQDGTMHIAQENRNMQTAPSLQVHGRDGTVINLAGILFYCSSISRSNYIPTATFRSDGRLLGLGFLQPFPTRIILRAMWALVLK
jgi:hypothetical protein